MGKSSHYRRCHVCGTVNHVEGDKVEKCSECGKGLSPFFYFDDRFTAVLTDNMLRPPHHEREYKPIYGVTVFWNQG